MLRIKKHCHSTTKIIYFFPLTIETTLNLNNYTEDNNHILDTLNTLTLFYFFELVKTN